MAKRFGIITFGFIAIILWWGWAGLMIEGNNSRISRWLREYQSEFVPAFDAVSFSIALAVTVLWVQVHADAGYTGVEQRAEIVALERPMDWQIDRKRGQIKTMAEGAEKAAVQAAEQVKAAVRAFVEHSFHHLKNIFRHRKVRSRGLAKNGHQLYALFGLANVMIGARQAAA